MWQLCVWENLIPFLGVDICIRLMNVCKDWNVIIQKCSLWKQILLKDFGRLLSIHIGNDLKILNGYGNELVGVLSSIRREWELFLIHQSKASLNPFALYRMLSILSKTHNLEHLNAQKCIICSRTCTIEPLNLRKVPGSYLLVCTPGETISYSEQSIKQQIAKEGHVQEYIPRYVLLCSGRTHRLEEDYGYPHHYLSQQHSAKRFQYFSPPPSKPSTKQCPFQIYLSKCKQCKGLCI